MHIVRLYTKGLRYQKTFEQTDRWTGWFLYKSKLWR